MQEEMAQAVCSKVVKKTKVTIEQDSKEYQKQSSLILGCFTVGSAKIKHVVILTNTAQTVIK